MFPDEKQLANTGERPLEGKEIGLQLFGDEY
jgi:hypothetical protein